MKIKKIFHLINKAIESFFVAVGFLGVISMILLAHYCYERPYYNPLHTLDKVTDMNYDDMGYMNCKSNSMGVGLDCNDVAYLEIVLNDTQLIEGEIYTYYDPVNNESVAHRLALCLDDDCNQTVFRGDNNKQGELVNRSQIEHRIMMVLYR